MGRVADRASFDSDVRLRLAEGDLDRMEAKDDALLAKIDSLAEVLNARIGKLLWALVGVLISVATTCIVILITAGVGR